MCQSLWKFLDPSPYIPPKGAPSEAGIDLEYCCVTRELGDDDARMQVRAEISTRRRPTSRRFESE